MPLVDILLATLGVFVIVLATREIIEDIPKIEVAADAVILCQSSQNVNLILRSDEPDLQVMPISLDSLSQQISELMPQGGAIVVGIADGCISGSPSPYKQLTMLDAALSVTSSENMFFQFHFIPLGEGAYSADALLAAIAGEGRWPPVFPEVE